MYNCSIFQSGTVSTEKGGMVRPKYPIDILNHPRPHGGMSRNSDTSFHKALINLKLIPANKSLRLKINQRVEKIILEHDCNLGMLNKLIETIVLSKVLTSPTMINSLTANVTFERSYSSQEIILIMEKLGKLKSFMVYSIVFKPSLPPKKAVALFNKLYKKTPSSKRINGEKKTDYRNVKQINISPDI